MDQLKSESSTSSPADGSSSSSELTVLIVDDHPAVREALTSNIDGRIGMRVIGEVGSAQHALELLERRCPDVAIVDISLNDAHGLDLIAEIREMRPSVRVLVFSMYDEGVYAERAIRAGASGYLMKREATDRVIEAIQSVNDGEVFLSQRMSSRILSKVIRQQEYTLSSATEELTDREMAVFQMLGKGHSMRDIADELDLSRKTIETYRRRAKEKLGFDTVSELLQYAVQWSYGRGSVERE
jgi:DNA-binding NarL/FixJ family response regulator